MFQKLKVLPTSNEANLSQFQRTFASFQHKNFRLWFIGQTISIIGSWMQTTAQGILIFQMTHSEAYLGYVGLANGIPSWGLMLYAGVIIDRVPRKKVIILTQSMMMVLAGILALLAFTGLVRPWHILLLSFFLGMANAFDAPARQAFIYEMVERKNLGNAIALNASLFNLASTLGPAISGVLYAYVGPAWCFSINTLSFVAVIIALGKMRITPPTLNKATSHTQSPPSSSSRSIFQEMKEGLRYTSSHPSIRTIMVIAAFTALFGMSYITLMPSWSVKVMQGGAMTNGFLSSARGLGALLAALWVATLPFAFNRVRLLALGQFIFPLMLLLFAVTRWMPLTLLTLFGAGGGILILYNMANTLIQSLVSDELRGRVMSIYSLSFFGCAPIGNLISGLLANRIGVAPTVILSSVLCLIFAILVWTFSPHLRKLL